MNNTEHKHSLAQKFNVLKNAINMSIPLYTAIVSTGVAAGLIGSYIYLTMYQNSLDHKYIWLFIKSNFVLTDTINFEGKELAVETIKNKLEEKVYALFEKCFYVFLVFFTAGAASAFKVTSYLSKKYTERNLNDKYVRGTILINEDSLHKFQKQNKTDGYYITDKIKIDREIETAGVFISGSSGSGKTTIIKRAYIEQHKHPKNVNAKWIIHDVKGDFLSQIYNEKTDYIYNMSDIRSIKFDVFNYIKGENDLKSIVSTLIPRSPDEKEPIWTDSARAVLEGILLYCIATDQKKLSLVQKMIKMNQKDLLKKFKEINGTETAIAFLSASESQVGNYLSNFQSKAKFFEGLSGCHDDKEAFDLEKWLKSDGQSTIFMLNDIKYQSINEVRVATFVNTLINIISSMGEDKNRRIYFFLDELGNAARIDKIITALTLLRSFGLSCWIGVQGISQFDKIYGKEDRQTIINSTSIKIIAKAVDPDTAKYMSETIGETENEISSLSSSVGVETNRDGQSFNKSLKKDFVVAPSQIQNLSNRKKGAIDFYFNQKGEPWTLIESEFIPKIDLFENVHAPFIMCPNLAQFNFSKKSEEVKEEVKEKQEEKPSVVTEENNNYVFG